MTKASGLVVFLLCAGAAASAFGEAGTTGATTLSRPLGARPSAMGDAFTAVEGGLDSIGYNPAGLAYQQRPAAQTQYSLGIVNDSFGAASYVHPQSFGSVWADALYYDAGTIHLNLSDGTNENVDAEQDFAGTVGASAHLGGGLSVGAAATAYRFDLAQQATAAGFAADLGAQWRAPLKGLTLGASVLNLGPDVKFEQEGDPLPLEGRVGAAYTIELSRQAGADQQVSRFTITADGVQPRDDQAWAGVGTEMRLAYGKSGAASLRLGYVFNNAVESVTFGVGLEEGRFFFDYALGDERAFSDANHFVFGVEF